MRLQISLSEEEIEQMQFYFPQGARHGEVILRFSEKRFVAILSKALEWKDQKILLAKSKDIEKP